MNEQQQQNLKKLYNTLMNQNWQGVDPYFPTLRELIGIQSEFDELKELLHSDQWPAAVDEHLICDPTSEEDKFCRAEGIVELIIKKNLRNKKFLDFGCGEGHTVHKTTKQGPEIAIGYDIEVHGSWNKFSSKQIIFTTDLKEVGSKGPYDAILIYDVLDHMPRGQTEMLRKLKNMLKHDGSVYLRTHPFCSRHATHLYHDLNKAFVHLVFTDEELQQLGMGGEPTARVLYPYATYHPWIQKSGFKIVTENVSREDIEPFFQNHKLIRQRIKRNFDPKNVPNFPTQQLKQQFCDYVLKHA
jgi:2-polyprenyl-3-methyl-5-hydroxy-6-metoxy-1,4-benzoquinol methylase